MPVSVHPCETFTFSAFLCIAVLTVEKVCVFCIGQIDRAEVSPVILDVGGRLGFCDLGKISKSNPSSAEAFNSGLTAHSFLTFLLVVKSLDLRAYSVNVSV